MSRKPLVSVVIPVYNEELTVGDVIGRVKATLEEMRVPYEILVVDDCSTDNSLAALKDENVKVYRLKRHMGKGYALRLGFKEASGGVIVTLDSDGSHNPEELPKLLRPVLNGEVDLVIGSRFLGFSNIFYNKLNRIGVSFFNILIRIITGKATTDSQSGYRVITSKALKELNLWSKGYEIESEVLIKVLRRGFRVGEVPIRFEQRTYGKSKLDPFIDGFKILRAILVACLSSW